MTAVGERHGFSVRTPIRDLSEEAIHTILYGTGDEHYHVRLSNGYEYNAVYEGVIPNLEKRHKETDSDFVRKDIERFMRERVCQTCHGARLKPVVLAITVHGLNITDMCAMDVEQTLEVLNSDLELTENEEMIARPILKEIKARVGFMKDVGLNYLELGRSAATLSGGEAQRIRLATQIGSGLQGVLYVLDEPSIGLHQRDNNRLIATLKHLRMIRIRFSRRTI